MSPGKRARKRATIAEAFRPGKHTRQAIKPRTGTANVDPFVPVTYEPSVAVTPWVDQYGRRYLDSEVDATP